MTNRVLPSVRCEIFAPSRTSERPTVVMIHGGAHTGDCYRRTPDGRPGWAHAFSCSGYRVVVPDWPGVGRSGQIDLRRITGEFVVRDLSTLIESLAPPIVLLTHSMAGCYGWRLLELHSDRIIGVIGVAPAPPGKIQPTAPIFAETDTVIETEAFGERLILSKIEPFIPTTAFVERKLIGGSRQFPRECLSTYAASLRPVPPRLLIERLNVGGSQLRLRDPSRLSGKRILVITGTVDFDHSREADGAIVFWLSANGANADFAFLGDQGIVGNGHMMMLERNSDEIARVILDWLDWD